jgi:AcrR family transcriptional regulator
MVHLRTVSDDPRDRLLAGMAAAIREQGFRATTVGDVVGHARTSRRTFYAHFPDRESCFFALLERMEQGVHAALAEAARGDAPFARRVDRTLAAWLELVDSDPALLRSALREAPGLGERGAAHMHAEVQRTAAVLVGLFEDARASDPEVRTVSIEEATVIAGGFRELIVTALDRGRPAGELHEVLAGLILRIGRGPEP